jgi:hypothetical protein
MAKAVAPAASTKERLRGLEIISGQWKASEKLAADPVRQRRFC